MSQAADPKSSSCCVGRHYHFVGIGGIGMSSLARLLLASGAIVSGSDRSESGTVESLLSEGASVVVGHRSENLHTSIGRPDVIVYSRAVPDDNPELAEAERLGIKAIHRAELLGELMRGRNSVCICGTHGKTTTTAMLALILQEAGKDPAVMLGGIYPPIGGNARSGRGPFVAEACEAYGSFLSLWPEIAVVTNIEPDHLDANTSFHDILDSFRTFLTRVPAHGRVIAGVDSPEVRVATAGLRAGVETYGMGTHFEQTPDWTAAPLAGGEWQILRRGKSVGVLRLQVPGDHNLLNALAAIAAATVLGVTPEQSAQALEAFAGVDRRFTVRGAAGGVLVVDDYAHHPTEIRATLAAARDVVFGPDSRDVVPGPAGVSLPDGFARSRDGRVIAVFQPHLYSRTAQFMDDFVESMADADIVLITEIYAAREDPLSGISGLALSEKLAKRWPGKSVGYEADLAALPDRIAAATREGDVVLTLGAGSITDVVPEVLKRLQQRAAKAQTLPQAMAS